MVARSGSTNVRGAQQGKRACDARSQQYPLGSPSRGSVARSGSTNVRHAQQGRRATDAHKRAGPAAANGV